MAKSKLKDALKRHLQNEQKERQRSKLEKDQKATQKEHKKMVNNKLRNVFKWSDGMLCDTPFRPDMNVLVVGDGDFTFSASLSKQLSNNANIIATVYDSKDKFMAKYGKETVAILEAAANVQRVDYGVDAQHLRKALCEEECKNLDVIVFNFPHTGSGIKDRARNVRGNQLLLSNFFSSCRSVLNADPDRTLTLSCSRTSIACNIGSVIEDKGKRPTPMVIVTLWCGDPYDDWKIKSLAKANGFGSVQAVPFRFADYPGYRHQRTDGLKFGDTMDACKESRMYIFSAECEGKGKGKKCEDSDDE